MVIVLVGHGVQNTYAEDIDGDGTEDGIKVAGWWYPDNLPRIRYNVLAETGTTPSPMIKAPSSSSSSSGSAPATKGKWDGLKISGTWIPDGGPKVKYNYIAEQSDKF